MAQEYEKYGDSYYSQYPTDDKKYECRTGPFEGFFVSSVEFCKMLSLTKMIEKIIEQEHKVQLGPPRPPGVQGLQGQTGPQEVYQVLKAQVFKVLKVKED